MSKTKCIDDALIWSADITEAFHQVVEWLHLCRERHHTKPGEVSLRGRYRRVCRVLHLPNWGATGGQVPPIDHGVPHTHQHHRYQVKVWPGKSGGIHICQAFDHTTKSSTPGGESHHPDILAPNVPHAAHQGITGMRARATSSIYWPGISADIASTRNRCSAKPPLRLRCHRQLPNSQSTPSSTSVLTSSTTKEQHIWCWLTGTLAGRLSPQPPTAPQDWPETRLRPSGSRPL